MSVTQQLPTELRVLRAYSALFEIMGTTKVRRALKRGAFDDGLAAMAERWLPNAEALERRTQVQVSLLIALAMLVVAILGITVAR